MAFILFLRYELLNAMHTHRIDPRFFLMVKSLAHIEVTTGTEGSRVSQSWVVLLETSHDLIRERHQRPEGVRCVGRKRREDWERGVLDASEDGCFCCRPLVA